MRTYLQIQLELLKLKLTLKHKRLDFIQQNEIEERILFLEKNYYIYDLEAWN